MGLGAETTTGGKIKVQKAQCKMILIFGF